MTDLRWITADVFDGLRQLDDNTVDLVLSSPPFLAVRSYLPADHPDKAKEIGGEATPYAFVETLLRVVAECDRVLAPHGSLVFELGDTYAGSGGGGGDYLPGGFREGQPGFGGSAEKQREGNAAHWRAKNVDKDSWPLAKSKALIPEAFALSLAYGFNVLGPTQPDWQYTPSPAGRWRIRNMIAWVRTNPPVGALGDKWRPAHSEIIVACRNVKRYWDDVATRVAYDEPPKVTRVGMASASKGISGGNPDKERLSQSPSGAPLRDWWLINNDGYEGSHYATYPPELVIPLVEAMCPHKVCRVCGEPSRRIVAKTPEYEAFRASKSNMNNHTDARKAYHLPDKGGVGSLDARDDAGARGQLYETLGWTDCERPKVCADLGSKWRPGHVLDPFAGTGTTLMVAHGHGRAATGIDLDPRNADLARERLGMFLEVAG